MKRIIIKPLLIGLCSIIIFGCSSKDEFSDTIFDTTDKASDPASSTYQFDSWLRQNYLAPYNLDFNYKMVDVASDMSYNLVPTSLDKSFIMAKLIKYLWFGSYDAAAGTEFLKQNGPRMIFLIGSPAYNTVSGTMTLGTAEGGIKVTLYKCNSVDYTDISMLNKYYFHTMHHEFIHILHQKKMFPIEFQQISVGLYSPAGWQNRSDAVAASLGFVSPYGGSQVREDFAELLSIYLTDTDAQWEALLTLANQHVNSIDDGVDGKTVILQKMAIATAWLKDSWDIDVNDLRTEIQTRQSNIDQLFK